MLTHHGQKCWWFASVVKQSNATGVKYQHPTPFPKKIKIKKNNEGYSHDTSEVPLYTSLQL